MKPLQIVLLLAAGVLGGALVTKVWHRSQTQPTMTAKVEAPAPPVVAPQPVTPAPAPPVIAAEPVSEPPAAKKPSPLPVRREVSRPRTFARVAPPPANPRPVDLGERVGPPPAAASAPLNSSVSIQAEAAPAPITVPAPVPARPEPEHMAPAPVMEPRKVTL